MINQDVSESISLTLNLWNEEVVDKDKSTLASKLFKVKGSQDYGEPDCHYHHNWWKTIIIIIMISNLIGQLIIKISIIMTCFINKTNIVSIIIIIKVINIVTSVII